MQHHSSWAEPLPVPTSHGPGSPNLAVGSSSSSPCSPCSQATNRCSTTAPMSTIPLPIICYTTYSSALHLLPQLSSCEPAKWMQAVIDILSPKPPDHIHSPRCWAGGPVATALLCPAHSHHLHSAYHRCHLGMAHCTILQHPGSKQHDHHIMCYQAHAVALKTACPDILQHIPSDESIQAAAKLHSQAHLHASRLLGRLVAEPCQFKRLYATPKHCTARTQVGAANVLTADARGPCHQHPTEQCTTTLC